VILTHSFLLHNFSSNTQSLAVDSETKDLKKVDRQLGGTRCIILCPTRELATQTATMAEKLCLKSFNWLVPGCLSGGEKRKSEKARLRKGVSILVATPGRLLDHITKTDCLLMSLKGKLEWLVLDEADRLLDMGLGGQVETIVQHIRANQPRSGIKRDGITWRSVLVSATVTPKIEDLAKKSLGGDAWVWARANKGKGGGLDTDEGGNELAHSAPKQLAQLHLTCSAKLRLPTLVAFLTARVQKGERIVVFMSTCDGVEFYHALFSKMGCILPRDNDEDDGSREKDGIFGDECSIFRLHGNVPHADRQKILKDFGSTFTKKASILFATDVAARGLNLPGLDWIVQYDAPCETADYVHRAGRAARAGKAGHALLFLLPSEKQFLEVLEIRGMKEMSALSLSATLNGAADICRELTAEGVKRSGGGYGSGSGSRSGEAFAASIQNKLEECIVEEEATYKDNLRKSLEQRKTKGANKILKNAIGELHEAAIKAYSAHIRSYPAKEKAVRHIFSPRALHLGHVARSFALKEQPKALSGKRRAADGSDDEDEDVLKSTGRKRNARLAFGDKGKEREDGNGKEAVNKATGGSKKAKKKRSLAESSDIAALEDIMKGAKKKKGKSSNKASDFGFGNGDRQSAGANQKKMLAMAQKMQGSGLSEFF
jgi:ATP-dependent RNA helicase DDX31/DBP7